MRVAERSWKTADGGNAPSDATVDLAFFSGSHQVLGCAARYHRLRVMFPTSHIFGYSAGREIRNDDVVGFYPCGEISPHRLSGLCVLHDTTMTGTTIAAVG
jgi:hypothetical protein